MSKRNTIQGKALNPTPENGDWFMVIAPIQDRDGTLHPVGERVQYAPEVASILLDVGALAPTGDFRNDLSDVVLEFHFEQGE